MSDDYQPAPLPPVDPARLRRPGETLSEYIDRVWPQAAQAASEVDRTLFQTTLPLAPIDRLHWATQAAWQLRQLARSVKRVRK